MGVHAAAALSARVRKLVMVEIAALSDPLPDLLFHYTTQSGLLGIFNSSALFLSDARFVNDRSEISYGRRVFTDRLRSYVADRADETAAKVWQYFEEATTRRAHRKLLGDAAWLGFEHFYMASFCTNGNLLSQWRAYGATSTGGCSIGFRSADLLARATVVGNIDSPAAGPVVALQRVRYEPDDQHQLIDRIISAVFSVTSLSGWHSAEARYLANTIEASVIPAVASQIKAPVFREEQEWRLVCHRFSGLRFRVQKDRVVPYLECAFGAQGAHFRERLPLASVYIGPSDYSDLMHISVVDYLRTNGVHDPEAIPIIPSEIPLRS
jgi:Protein of unknown function (DUF2971)